MTSKPRPTDAEFEELKRKRDAAIRESFLRICKEQGWDPAKTQLHSHAGECYCDCPDGPCQHLWDGPDWTSDSGNAVSVTCSRCGAVAMHHDMRCGP